MNSTIYLTGYGRNTTINSTDPKERKGANMITISLSELKSRTGKYIDLAADEDTICVTKRGRPVAKIVRAAPDIMSLIGFLPPDADLDEAREERLREKMR